MNEPILTVAQMRAAERAAMDAGASEWELMQRAGEGAAQWVMRVAARRPVTGTRCR
jgi:NAD(P)H-hydrate repair Nnr-like enzyme with NAD(P)H-hydrate epimerase domain